MTEAREFTSAEKYEAAVREVKMRRSLYPRWVKSGKLRSDQAEWGIAIMESIASDYRKAGVADRSLLI